MGRAIHRLLAISIHALILADPVGKTAYENLKPQTKKGILPTFELCWRPKAHNFEHSLEVLRAAATEHPFLLDIDKRMAPEPYISSNPKDPLADKLRYQQDLRAKRSFDAEVKKLLRPTDGFFNWRELVSHFPTAVPVLQVTNPNRDRQDVLRQAQLLCVGGASAALRITDVATREVCALAADIILSLDDPTQLLLIFDCGQGRTRLGQRSAFVKDALKSIQEAVGPERTKLLRAVCMSNSFRLPSHKGTRLSENYDWELWRQASVSGPLAFGDYAGSQRDNSHSSYRLWDYRATVVHSLPEGWLICRHANKNDPIGWLSGCKIIDADLRFRPLASWCDEAIHKAAASGVSTSEEPRFWNAARINGHIERQFAYAIRLIKRAA